VVPNHTAGLRGATHQLVRILGALPHLAELDLAAKDCLREKSVDVVAKARFLNPKSCVGYFEDALPVRVSLRG